ncbi:MAG: hypothetical protein WC436_03700 [Candidatus Babeliales bacterium]
MLKQNFIKTLKLLAARIDKSGIEWFVTGKTNLALQGIDLQPSHLGILIRHKDLNNFKKLFSDFKQSNLEFLENGQAWEFFIFIDDVKILVCAEYDHGIYWIVNENPVNILVEDIKISCFSLESEKAAYEKMGREKDLFKIQKIKDRLECINAKSIN